MPDPSPPSSPSLEAWLDSYHVDWQYEPALPLDRIDTRASRANQARIGEPIISEVAERYAAAMRRGDQFPPIVTHQRTARSKHVIIGGNHRHAAAVDAGLTALPAYVVRAAEPEAVLALTYEDNARHGYPPSNAERIRQAVHLIGIGWTAKAAADAVGVSEALVSTARKATEGARRAEDLGVPGFDLIAAQASQVELARLPSDPVFEQATRAVVALGLSVADTKALVKDLRACRSERDQLAHIGAYLEERQATAQQRGGGRAARRGIHSPKGKLQSALTSILELSPAELADTITDAPSRQRAREKLRRVVDQLAAIDRALR